MRGGGSGREEKEAGTREEDGAGRPPSGLGRCGPHALIRHLLCARRHSTIWDPAKNKAALAPVREDFLFQWRMSQGVHGWDEFR